MLYLDTSLLISILTPEAESARAQNWLKDQGQDEFAISDWTVAEFSSALAINLRSRKIAEADRAEALATFSRMARDNFTSLPIDSAHFHRAAQFADRYELGLRAADALHLAICVDFGATFCTLDRRVARVGPAFGARVIAV